MKWLRPKKINCTYSRKKVKNKVRISYFLDLEDFFFFDAFLDVFLVLNNPFGAQNRHFNEMATWRVQIGIRFPDVSGILPIGATKKNFS